MKIMVVDDVQFTCISMKKILEHAGHKVIVANSGQDALEFLRTNPDTGLVITDLLMEGMNGKEFYLQAQKLKVFNGLGAMSLPPFVLMTAGTSVEDREEADQLGFRMVLQKPVSTESLAKTIDQLTRIQSNEKALHLVIADSQGTTFEWFQTMFDDTPHQLIRCKSAKEVLERHESGEPMSIIVAEAELDDMPATKLFKRIKGRQLEKVTEGRSGDIIPFLLITDGLAAQQLKDIRDAGIKDMMSKPLDLAVIAEKLSKLSKGTDYKRPKKMADEILVVDDVGFNLVILEKTFKDLDYVVHRASSGYEAIEHMQQPNRIKAVFCDLVMPGLDGVDMLRYLKAKLGKNLPPFVLVTASSDEMRINDATCVGFKHVLRKPLQISEVQRTLNELLAPPKPVELVESLPASTEGELATQA
jgi:CheY-like chemotaxis protein